MNHEFSSTHLFHDRHIPTEGKMNKQNESEQKKTKNLTEWRSPQDATGKKSKPAIINTFTKLNTFNKWENIKKKRL